MGKIIEARLTDSVADATMTGQLHSCFRSVINVVFFHGTSEYLITIMPYGYCGIPDSLMVGNAIFEQLALLPVGTKVQKEKLCFRFETVVQPLVGESDCLRKSTFSASEQQAWVPDRYVEFTAALDRYRRQKRKTDGLAFFSETFRDGIIARLKELCKAWLAQDKSSFDKILPYCLGAGKGLTPSSDDMLIGIMAVIHGAQAFGIVKSFPFQNRGELETAIRGKTVDVSKKYLLCASEGRFSEGILQLLSAVFLGVNKDWTRLIELVGSVGSTSGADILYGIQIGLQSINEYCGYT